MTTQTSAITVDSIDALLDDFFERSIDQAKKVDPSYETLWLTLHRITRSGGKRLRPKITLLSYAAFGGRDTEAIMPVATAQELLHISLLIHDDIIDRDYIRRGVPNVAGTYRSIYSSYLPESRELDHYANSSAILGGDLMLASAYQLIMDSALTAEQKLIAHRSLSEGVTSVAAGQLLDTESSFKPPASGGALKTALYKTASYSFVTPLLTGARLAGIEEIQDQSIRTFGESLGIAFQLVDDVLCVFGDEAVTGKSNSSDIREGKRTYMIECALDVMTDDERLIFDEGFARPEATARAIDQVKELLVTTGARKRTESKIAECKTTAEEALADLQLTPEYDTEFQALIRKVTERSF